VPTEVKLPEHPPSAECFLDLVQQLHDVKQQKITWLFGHERSVGHWILINAFMINANIRPIGLGQDLTDIRKWTTLLMLADMARDSKLLDILFEESPTLRNIQQVVKEKQTVYSCEWV